MCRNNNVEREINSSQTPYEKQGVRPHDMCTSPSPYPSCPYTCLETESSLLKYTP